MSTDPFRSARLLYRAAEADSDEDLALFHSINSDAAGYGNANARIHKPQGKADAKRDLKCTAEEDLLGVIICLPPPVLVAEPQSKPIPIGILHLCKLEPHLVHMRDTDIAIDILPAYQGKGYGSEAIKWCLRWAFMAAGLHRVGIAAFAYNEGAVRLYGRLGFAREGVRRQCIWHEGRWWDEVQFGMLEDEWRETQKQESEQ